VTWRIAVEVLPGCRGRVRVPELRRIARLVLEAEGVVPATGVEVVLADATTVQELNRLYRGHDEPTDVLSFAEHEAGAFVETPQHDDSLGEVIVCLPVAEEQATAAGRPVVGEVAHLLVHGLLHILGYDHEDPDDAAEMKTREDELLAPLGYAGAYEHGH
jgi:probable rRNA maturation factor